VGVRDRNAVYMAGGGGGAKPLPQKKCGELMNDPCKMNGGVCSSASTVGLTNCIRKPASLCERRKLALDFGDDVSVGGKMLGLPASGHSLRDVVIK
jgi:hypothetical protein